MPFVFIISVYFQAIFLFSRSTFLIGDTRLTPFYSGSPPSLSHKTKRGVPSERASGPDHVIATSGGVEQKPHVIIQAGRVYQLDNNSFIISKGFSFFV